jgi:hypothetical protein
MPARDMAVYMRARRARQKAEREAAEPVVDAALPRDAIMKASDRELKSIWAKAAAIGPGAVITKTHGRLDVLSRAAFETRDNTSPLPSRAVARYEPPAAPPRSMVAIGGKPGHGLIPQGSGYAPPISLPSRLSHEPRNFALRQKKCCELSRPGPMNKSGGSSRSKPLPPIVAPTPLSLCERLLGFSTMPSVAQPRRRAAPPISVGEYAISFPCRRPKASLPAGRLTRGYQGDSRPNLPARLQSLEARRSRASRL